MKTKTGQELLDILVEADEDIRCDRTAPLKDTFDSLRKELEAVTMIYQLIRKDPFDGLAEKNNLLKTRR